MWYTRSEGHVKVNNVRERKGVDVVSGQGSYGKIMYCATV